MSSWKAGFLFALGVGVGLALSFTLGGTGASRGSLASSSPSSREKNDARALPRPDGAAAASPEAKRVLELEGELESSRAALKRADETRDAAQKELARSRDASAPGKLSHDRPASSDATRGAQDAAAIAAKIKKIEVEAETALKTKDWKGAISLLKELRKIAPDAGEASWPSIAKLTGGLWQAASANDVSRDLVSAFYRIAGADEFCPLYAKAVSTPEGNDLAFRIFAVEALSWSGAEGTAEIFLGRLGVETEATLAMTLANSLPGLGKEHLDGIVTALRVQTNADVRHALVQALSGIEGGEATRALARVAESEPDGPVKATAQQAVTARSAPVMGYMISDVVKGSQAEAAGVKAGDILVSYNGVVLSNYNELMKAKKAVQDGASVTVGIYRGGATLNFVLKSGQIGINGQFVYPPTEAGR
ncbi:PDZ domain-containing protein [bacterium]|nr:PDZ domain-containing protein [bacterium]